MKKDLFVIVSFVLGVCATACRSVSHTAKDVPVEVEEGVKVGASSGALIGNDGRSEVIGTTTGRAAGAAVRTAIGGQMDKVAAEVAVLDNAVVDSFTDANGLKALRVTFAADGLFGAGKGVLREDAKGALAGLADVLKRNPDVRVLIFGHTDNVGTFDENRRVSQEQAAAVARFLRSMSVPATQIKEVGGRGFSDPIASNATAAGQARNRRVDIYMYAGEGMIEADN